MLRLITPVRLRSSCVCVCVVWRDGAGHTHAVSVGELNELLKTNPLLPLSILGGLERWEQGRRAGGIEPGRHWGDFEASSSNSSDSTSSSGSGGRGGDMHVVETFWGCRGSPGATGGPTARPTHMGRHENMFSKVRRVPFPKRVSQG